MPWKPKDAFRHTHKATTPAARRQWTHVANSALAQQHSESAAIRMANAAVTRRKKPRRDRDAANPADRDHDGI